MCLCVQQVCAEEAELVPVDSLEIFRPLTVCDGLPLEGCVLSIRYYSTDLLQYCVALLSVTAVAEYIS